MRIDDAGDDGAASKIDRSGALRRGRRILTHRYKSPVADGDCPPDRIFGIHGMDSAVNKSQLGRRLLRRTFHNDNRGRGNGSKKLTA